MFYDIIPKLKLYGDKMRVAFCFLIFNLLLNANDSFITKMEYAKMLYQNPRGIGCDKCHGIKGNGKIIAKYKEKGKNKYLKSPQINNVSKELFFKSFTIPHKIMPKYFLTYGEINTLYQYLQNLKKIKKGK